MSVVRAGLAEKAALGQSWTWRRTKPCGVCAEQVPRHEAIRARRRSLQVFQFLPSGLEDRPFLRMTGPDSVAEGSLLQDLNGP